MSLLCQAFMEIHGDITAVSFMLFQISDCWTSLKSSQLIHPLSCTAPPNSLSHELRFVHSAEEAFDVVMFKLDSSLSNGDEKREDRINQPLILCLLSAVWILINIHTPIQFLHYCHLSNEERCPSNYIHWRQPVLAFFQTVVTSDSVGAGVMAQHEHHTLLSRHCSVTSMRSEIWKGNS